MDGIGTSTCLRKPLGVRISCTGDSLYFVEDHSVRRAYLPEAGVKISRSITAAVLTTRLADIPPLIDLIVSYVVTAGTGTDAVWLSPRSLFVVVWC